MGTQVVTVSLAGQSHQYGIEIGRGVLPTLGQRLRQVLPDSQRVLLVTDEHVARHYLAPTMASLQAAGLAAHSVTLPSGEASKNLHLFEHLLSQAQQAGIKRRDAIVALGGGVIGDLAGFCAGSYYRGTGFVQVPTTLLAQVDSSVGGKVAVNLGAVKNCVGSFYQPHLVLMDLDTLATLPPREMRAGLAELFKYALIERTACLGTSLSDEESLWRLFQQVGGQWQEALPQLVVRACAIKAAVVMRDETESLPALDASGRVCLNLGHTYGHAYEAALGYDGTLLHGEGVAIGMVHAVETSRRLGLLSEAMAGEIVAVMGQLGLPVRSPVPVDAQALVAHMQQDKKVIGDKIRLILPTEPMGTVVVRDDVPLALLQDLLEAKH